MYPSSARVTGTAVCFAARRCGAMFGALTYEWMARLTGSFHHFFVGLAIACTINLLLIQMLPDSAGEMDSKDGGVDTKAAKGRLSYGAAH